MKVIESDVECRTCGERMSCMLTGPEREPHTRATYICPNMDWRYVCQGRGYADAFDEERH